MASWELARLGNNTLEKMRTRSELVVLVVNPALQTKITLARKSFTVDFPTIIVIVKFFSTQIVG